MSKSRPLILAVYSITILLNLSCGAKSRYPEDTVPSGSQLEPISIISYNPAFDETARFIAATGVSENSPLLVTSRTKEYVAYKNSIDKSWNGFFLENLKKIHEWTESQLRAEKHRSVFYPFSGPDILHALSFYPESRDILMFGLEPTGGIPYIHSLPVDKVLHYLKGLAPALNFTLNHAFFVTTDMQKNLGRNPFTGITGIMMFFLSRAGYEVVSVRMIGLDRTGSVINPGTVKEKNTVEGIEIIFSRGSGTELRRVRYFRLDVGNRSAKLPRFVAYCKKYPPFATIIKSASYLMHNDTFSTIRNVILDQSSSIIQDDSGVPYKDFSPTRWDIRFYGKYHRPLPVFKYRYQPELEKAVAQNSSGSLPFSYGYGYGYADITYHILYARRKR